MMSINTSEAPNATWWLFPSPAGEVKKMYDVSVEPVLRSVEIGWRYHG
jgi:hypothetical protein